MLEGKCCFFVCMDSFFYYCFTKVSIFGETMCGFSIDFLYNQNKHEFGIIFKQKMFSGINSKISEFGIKIILLGIFFESKQIVRKTTLLKTVPYIWYWIASEERGRSGIFLHFRWRKEKRFWQAALLNFCCWHQNERKLEPSRVKQAECAKNTELRSENAIYFFPLPSLGLTYLVVH